MKLPKPYIKKSPVNPAEVIRVLGEVAERYLELQKVKEIEETKRKAIDERISLIRSSVNAFIEEFRDLRAIKLAERREALEMFREFYALAANSNNHEMVKIIGDHVVNILTSPIIRYEEIAGLVALLEPLKGNSLNISSNMEALPEKDDEDIIPAEIVL